MPFKGFNSKGFLILYLAVISIVLLVWLSRQEISQPDNRQLPETLSPFLLSPAKPLPQFLLHSNAKEVLTNNSLKQRWTFVYFTHRGCLPECEAVFQVLHNLQRLFVSAEMQYVLIDYVAEQQAHLAADFIDELTVYSADQQQLDDLAAAFDFLYLSNPTTQGYKLEQQHDIFLLDPKGRIYARFKPPFTSLILQQQFLAIRDFYARTE